MLIEKNKYYARLKFHADTIQDGLARFTAKLAAAESAKPAELLVDFDGASWGHDSLPEFWADYRRGTAAHLDVFGDVLSKRLIVSYNGSSTRVDVTGPDRAWIEEVFEVFERGVDSAEKSEPPPTPPAPPPVVFIGHGRSPQWKDLRDHLRDQQGIEVVVFESGARAGHAIRDILEEMTDRSSIAFLVLTADDEAVDGQRARQNVVHELGLCQGKLGFGRAIALAEDGVQLFSNLDGVQQIRFPQGGIRETFGDVLATIRREFPTAR